MQMSLSYFAVGLIFSTIFYSFIPQKLQEKHSAVVFGASKYFNMQQFTKLLGKFTHILTFRLSLKVYFTFSFVNNMIANIFLSSVRMVCAVFSPSD